MCGCPKVIKLYISDGEVIGTTLGAADGLYGTIPEGVTGIGLYGGIGHGSDYI